MASIEDPTEEQFLKLSRCLPGAAGGDSVASNAPAAQGESQEGDGEYGQGGKPPMQRARFRMQFSKTQKCRFFAKGHCWDGEGCRFAHGGEDMRVMPNLNKTSVCKKWTQGQCRESSETCPFAHGTWELRVTSNFLKTTLCRAFFRGVCSMGDQCRHAHNNNELRHAHHNLQLRNVPNDSRDVPHDTQVPNGFWSDDFDGQQDGYTKRRPGKEQHHSAVSSAMPMQDHHAYGKYPGADRFPQGVSPGLQQKQGRQRGQQAPFQPGVQLPPGGMGASSAQGNLIPGDQVAALLVAVAQAASRNQYPQGSQPQAAAQAYPHNLFGGAPGGGQDPLGTLGPPRRNGGAASQPAVQQMYGLQPGMDSQHEPFHEASGRPADALRSFAMHGGGGLGHNADPRHNLGGNSAQAPPMAGDQVAALLVAVTQAAEQKWAAQQRQGGFPNNMAGGPGGMPDIPGVGQPGRNVHVAPQAPVQQMYGQVQGMDMQQQAAYGSPPDPAQGTDEELLHEVAYKCRAIMDHLQSSREGFSAEGANDLGALLNRVLSSSEVKEEEDPLVQISKLLTMDEFTAVTPQPRTLDDFMVPQLRTIDDFSDHPLDLQEWRNLRHWREQQPEVSAPAGAPAEPEPEQEDERQRLLREMSGLQERMEQLERERSQSGHQGYHQDRQGDTQLQSANEHAEQRHKLQGARHPNQLGLSGVGARHPNQLGPSDADARWHGNGRPQQQQQQQHGGISLNFLQQMQARGPSPPADALDYIATILNREARQGNLQHQRRHPAEPEEAPPFPSFGQ